MSRRRIICFVVAVISASGIAWQTSELVAGRLNGLLCTVCVLLFLGSVSLEVYFSSRKIDWTNYEAAMLEQAKNEMTKGNNDERR